MNFQGQGVSHSSKTMHDMKMLETKSLIQFPIVHHSFTSPTPGNTAMNSYNKDLL